jgi:hypothetical protein
MFSNRCRGSKSLNIFKLFFLNFFEIWIFDKYRIKDPDPDGIHVSFFSCLTIFGVVTSFYPEIDTEPVQYHTY